MERQQNYVEAFKQWLLPSDTFAKSETPRRDLACARLLVAILYLVMTGVLLFTVVRLYFSGRVEVVRTGFKLDVVEAPSLAICPFFSRSSIIVPAAAKPAVVVEHLNRDQAHRVKEDALHVNPRMCIYDRDCVCVDLFNVTLRDSSNIAHAPGYHEPHDKRRNAEIFRERIAVSTTLMDPSPEQTLKVGFYDSVDRAPNWFYVNQGHYSIGQLELQVWTITDMTFQGLWATVRGDFTAMARQRHIYRYTSQEVGDRGDGRNWNQSTIIYEMKNFFVDETVSSETAFSVYTLGFLFVMIAARSWVIESFFGVVMPEWQKPKEGATVRDLTPAARMLSNCFCSCLSGREDTAGEQRPLRV